MEHKLIVAKNLREGLAWLQILYESAFYSHPFYEQWKYFQSKQLRGTDFDETKLLIENDFSHRARLLYLRLKIKSGRAGD